MPKVQKMPAILFYTGDWLKDPAVRMMTLTQRGLWIDMLSLMYESSDRGYLSLKNGQPVSTEQLCRMVGCLDIKTVEECLEAMESVGVFSRTKDGVIYSRRMVNDEKIREAKAKAGRASGKSRNKKGTQPEQKRNTQATALEYETETEIEVPVVDSSSDQNNSNWTCRHIVQQAWMAIPVKRQRGRGRFQTAIIENVVEENVDVEKVKSALIAYYESDEGRGKWWRTPPTLIEDIIWEENPEQWSNRRGEEKGFPHTIFDHDKIVQKYRSDNEENEKNYQAHSKKLKDGGLQASEITTRIAYKVWNKHPKYRI